MDTIKVSLLGSGGVGKTTWVQRLRNMPFNPRYEATMGVEIIKIPIYTTRGQVKLEIWDQSGQDKFCGLREGYMDQAEAAIIMFDLGSNLTYKQSKEWKNDFVRITAKNNIVLVGNKSDINPQIRINEPHIQISNKSGQFIWNPILELLRNHFNDPELEIV